MSVGTGFIPSGGSSVYAHFGLTRPTFFCYTYRTTFMEEQPMLPPNSRHAFSREEKVAFVLVIILGISRVFLCTR